VSHFVTAGWRMKMTLQNEFPFPARRYYRGDAIPMRVIRRFARAIADSFHPDKIILFGSHAYGTPHEDSDVDLLVVMPARNQLDQAYRIRLAFTAPFALDLIVRTPKEMAWRLDEGESFLTEIVSKGKVLYEKGHARVGKKGRGRLSGHDRSAPSRSSRS
jgi:predicted nucleotidyltransferase